MKWSEVIRSWPAWGKPGWHARDTTVPARRMGRAAGRTRVDPAARTPAPAGAVITSGRLLPAADRGAGRASGLRPGGLRQHRRREGDVDGQAAAWSGFRADRGAVGGGDRLDEGQSQAMARRGYRPDRERG
jgi:hypothetical protein